MFSEECKTQTRGLLLDLLATQTEHNQGAAAEPPEKVCNACKVCLTCTSQQHWI